MSKSPIIELTQDDIDSIEIKPNDATPTIDPKAFFGILKDITKQAESNSEAPPIAVALNTIGYLSALIGRRVYQQIGDAIIHCRPFILMVGKSSKARKGTAEALPHRIFKRADELLTEKNSKHLSLTVHGGGLSSGEGIAYAIRDASGRDKSSDPGVPDKRLLVIEPEFGSVLANCKRETSTLSPILRNVFDGKTLSPLTKNDRVCATNPHVVILAHITHNELHQKISRLEINNGLLNRFLMCHVTRTKLVPIPTRTPESMIDTLANEIVEIIQFIDTEYTHYTSRCGFQAFILQEAGMIYERKNGGILAVFRVFFVHKSCQIRRKMDV